MSGLGSQLARSGSDAGTEGRSSLVHLLHALNQPLTGLQCSMELTLAAPRTTDHYIRTLGEGLELVSRMRLLVEAVREITEIQTPAARERVVILLDNLLREVGQELQPVAASKHVRLGVSTSAPLPVRADLGPLTTLLFRAIECAISLALEGSAVRVQPSCDQSAATINILWVQGELPEHSPFSRPELGLLIAQAAWERLGGTCTRSQTGDTQRWILQIPLAWTTSHPNFERHFVQGAGQR